VTSLRSAQSGLPIEAWKNVVPGLVPTLIVSVIPMP